MSATHRRRKVPTQTVVEGLVKRARANHMHRYNRCLLRCNLLTLQKAPQALSLRTRTWALKALGEEYCIIKQGVTRISIIKDIRMNSHLLNPRLYRLTSRILRILHISIYISHTDIVSVSKDRSSTKYQPLQCNERKVTRLITPSNICPIRAQRMFMCSVLSKQYWIYCYISCYISVVLSVFNIWYTTSKVHFIWHFCNDFVNHIWILYIYVTDLSKSRRNTFVCCPVHSEYFFNKHNYFDIVENHECVSI